MEDIMDYVLKITKELKIDVEFSPEFDKDTPSVANVPNHLVILNSNWRDPNELVFHLLHEVGHIVNGDSYILYNATYSPLAKSEANANKFAIEVLFAIYFENCRLKKANIDNFMTMFSIPHSLRNICEEELLEYYVMRPAI